MKKISFFSILLLAAGLILAGGALTSCGSDDDNKTDPQGGGGGGSSSGGSQSGIVGNTWYNIDEQSNRIEIEAYQFNSDGTGLGGELKRKSSDNYSRTSGEQWDISYTINGDILTITELIEGESDVNTYKFVFNADGTMTLTRVKDGNVGNSHIFLLLPPTQDPNAALEAIMEGLAERKRNN